jgi:tRNA A22 N-methylase
MVGDFVAIIGVGVIAGIGYLIVTTIIDELGTRLWGKPAKRRR